MMLSQSLGSRLWKKTPHSKDFEKMVQREAGGRNVSRSRVQFACRSALGDHPSFPTPEEDAPLLSQLPTPIVNAPLLMEFPTPERDAPLQNDNFPHQSGVVEYAPLL